MTSQDDIENRKNHILGVIAARADALNEVLNPIIDMLQRSENPDLLGLREAVKQDQDMAKLDIVTDAAEMIAQAEYETETRYRDDQLFEKIRADLNELAAQLAGAERGGRDIS